MRIVTGGLDVNQNEWQSRRKCSYMLRSRSDHQSTIKEEKCNKCIVIIQNTEFATAFPTVSSTYTWPVNPFMALSKVHLIQVSVHKNWRKLICKLTLDSSATLL